jgi:hypothetical protein
MAESSRSLPKEFSMKPNIFMSYSRREVGFVDDLTHRLETDGFKVWLDYRSLVPGTPWAGQIDKVLDESQVILLVVSKASIASKYVELEWRRVIKEAKRIILVIFEAVDLPKELEQYEWVDFRGKYEAGLKELVGQLQAAVLEDHPVPETGFKIPMLVWVAIGLSSVVSFFSIGSFWTIFLPWLLIPLPYRILKRNFNFTMLQAALVFLPFALYVTSWITTDEDLGGAIEQLSYVSAIFAIALLLILRSPAFQRWGKPEATMPKFANLYRPDNPNPKPIPFFVDHAIQDRAAADELTQVLKKYGHPQADDIRSARAVFVLCSHFKNDTRADPQKQVVFPVILQGVDIAPEISKVQWIDFRAGLRNLDAIAQLLPEPDRLLQALGVRPMGNNLLLPPVILYLAYFIASLAIFTVGLWLPYFYQYLDDILSIEGLGSILAGLAISLILFGLLCYFMVRGIVDRRGLFASVSMIVLGIIVLGVLVYWQDVLNLDFLDAVGSLTNENDLRGFSADYPPYIYGIGSLAMAIFMAIRFRDVRFWFPAKGEK